MESLILRTLLSAAAPSTDHGTTPSTDHGAPTTDTSGGHGSGHSTVSFIDVDPHHFCYCGPWLHSHGPQWEFTAARACQWLAFAVSIGILIFYAYHSWKSTCGWEEVYVCCVELVKICLEIWHEFDSPCMLYLSTGNQVLWLRYAEWLLTCPVILIHLSNLTGLQDDYSKRTMRLLVSDIGTIVWGVSSCMASFVPLKIFFFLLGCAYGSSTLFQAAKIYVESYHQMPKGQCKALIRIMAWVFFSSWAMFPILFVLGPESFGHLTGYGTTIGHTVIDLMSKNIWGLLGHHLRVKIHEHILIHGDIRKTNKITVAGEDMEVETFVEEEDEDTVKHSTKELANRESFIIMRDRMKARGIDVRASLDDSPEGKYGMEGGGMGKATLEAGRVILAVPDISMVDFFREIFAGLPGPIELVPALGGDNTLQLVQQAASLGGCDLVLIHPEFLRDRSPSSLAGRLRQFGQRVAAFGWAPTGPMRELIESSGLDGYLEGPSFGSGIHREQLIGLIARMQTARRGGMGGMAFSGFSDGSAFGMNNLTKQSMGGMSMGGMSNNGGMGMQQQHMHNGMAMNSFNNSGGMMMNNSGMMMNQNSMNNRVGANPLFGSTPSPLSSQMGGSVQMQPMGMMAQAAPAGPTPAAPATGMSEAEMLQQLMGEISRLKNELGEST